MTKEINFFVLRLACENLSYEEMGRLLEAMIIGCFSDDVQEAIEKSKELLVGNEKYVWPMVNVLAML